MAGGFKRIEDYDVVAPGDLPDDAVVYVVLPSESTPALIDRNWTWAGFKSWLTGWITGHSDVNANTIHRSSNGNTHSSVVSNTNHKSSDGSSHSFINQNLTTAAGPTFNGGVQTDGTKLRTKVIPTGTWNMQGGSLTISHGLTLSTIRDISVMVRNDDNDEHRLILGNYNTLNAEYRGGFIFIKTSDIVVIVVDSALGGIFDSVNYNSTAFNRGWITITYEV